jgi:O-antigen/teichoic acid export membrane protein
MSVIQKQSIRSSIVIMIGFAIGAINIIFLAPKVLTAEQLGLTRIITDAGITLASMCTLGALPVINKFFPFYKSYLTPQQNDLPFITFVICLAGFIIMCTAGYLLKDIVVRKFSERSPLFVRYSYLVYPFALFILLFLWLESFSWSFRKGVLSNSLKETVTRVIFSILLLILSLHIVNIHQFFTLFSLSYLIPVCILFYILRKTSNFRFIPAISPLTDRIKGRMISFGLYIFGAQFLNLLSRTVDTFILSSKSARGLSDAAVFTIATYVVTLMEIPQRSITSITVPVLAESWKNKDLRHIKSVYIKSVSNLLIIGLVMFAIIWLNSHNLGKYLGKDFSGIEKLVLLMGIGKLIDLGTGANAQIIATSSYWKVDFTTNVFYTLLALPLNYILISNYGLIGAAYSTLISLTFYNAMRFGFLWYKFKMQPYSWRNFLAIALAIVCTAIVYIFPQNSSPVLDTVIRTISFLLLFLPTIYFTHISGEINSLIRNYLNRIIRWLAVMK